MSKGRVLLGVVAAPHGVRGLVRIRSFTEDPMAIASYGALSDEKGTKEYRVEALSSVKGAVLARIEGVADRTAAEAVRGLRLYVERDRLPETAEREWYEADLIGLAAFDRLRRQRRHDAALTVAMPAVQVHRARGLVA